MSQKETAKSANADPVLPYVDEHAVRIAVPRELVWAALDRFASSLGVAEGSLPARLLGTEPPAGFEISETVPGERLTLKGRHRFSRYRLVFELDDTGGGGTQLRAQTYAVFPHLRGRVYRALVIGSRAHVVATNRMLHSIRRQSLQQAAAQKP